MKLSAPAHAAGGLDARQIHNPAQFVHEKRRQPEAWQCIDTKFTCSTSGVISHGSAVRPWQRRGGRQPLESAAAERTCLLCSRVDVAVQPWRWEDGTQRVSTPGGPVRSNGPDGRLPSLPIWPASRTGARTPAETQYFCRAARFVLEPPPTLPLVLGPSGSYDCAPPPPTPRRKAAHRSSQDATKTSLYYRTRQHHRNQPL